MFNEFKDNQCNEGMKILLVTLFTILFTLSFCFMPAAIANKFMDDFDFWTKVAYNII